MRHFFQGLIVIVCIVLGVAWIKNPSGPYEPIIVTLGMIGAAIDFFRQGKAKSVVSSGNRAADGLALLEKKSEQVTPSSLVDFPRFVWSSTAHFFSDRFASAFPGIRVNTWYQGQDAVTKFSQLLRSPLTFKTQGNAFTSPIWWYGRGNLQIESFSQIDERIVLMNYEELKISRLAAIYSNNYKKLWVYVETEPLPATGLYPNTAEYLAKAISNGEVYSEEYALVDEKKKITRAEYDDGFINSSGSVIDIRGRSHLRVRYLTANNFLLASHESDINNTRFDDALESLLDAVLKNPNCFASLVRCIERLHNK
jgi:hypothetical protein